MTENRISKEPMKGVRILGQQDPVFDNPIDDVYRANLTIPK